MCKAIVLSIQLGAVIPLVFLSLVESILISYRFWSMFQLSEDKEVNERRYLTEIDLGQYLSHLVTHVTAGFRQYKLGGILVLVGLKAFFLRG